MMNVEGVVFYVFFILKVVFTFMEFMVQVCIYENIMSLGSELLVGKPGGRPGPNQPDFLAPDKSGQDRLSSVHNQEGGKVVPKPGGFDVL